MLRRESLTMSTYAELRERLETALRATRRDLAILEHRVKLGRDRYGRAFDHPERRATLIGRIAEIELNLEALEYDRAAECAAADPTE